MHPYCCDRDARSSERVRDSYSTAPRKIHRDSLLEGVEGADFIRGAMPLLGDDFHDRQIESSYSARKFRTVCEKVVLPRLMSRPGSLPVYTLKTRPLCAVCSDAPGCGHLHCELVPSKSASPPERQLLFLWHNQNCPLSHSCAPRGEERRAHPQPFGAQRSGPSRHRHQIQARRESSLVVPPQLIARLRIRVRMQDAPHNGLECVHHARCFGASRGCAGRCDCRHPRSRGRAVGTCCIAMKQYFSLHHASLLHRSMSRHLQERKAWSLSQACRAKRRSSTSRASSYRQETKYMK